VPGVRRALLISRDGVPLTSLGPQEPSAQPAADAADDEGAFAGLVAGLVAELGRAVDPLSWDRPRRIVLRAARGTLVLCLTERLSVCVELERGMAAEDVRLPLQAVLARLERATDRDRDAARPSAAAPQPEPPGLFPGATDASSGASPGAETPGGSRVPETTTDN
jgi:predicted regulator of Ras-like GTPase activity (Roadblock/LC7/MglB family)